jgi:tRNA-binding protein
MPQTGTPLSQQDFEKMDIRVGTVIEVSEFPEARIPAWKLRIDFGAEGVKSSSARITELYPKSVLLGKQLIAVINFAPKLIGPFLSECLVLGVMGENSQVVLLQPERKVTDGQKIA